MDEFLAALPVGSSQHGLRTHLVGGGFCTARARPDSVTAAFNPLTECFPGFVIVLDCGQAGHLIQEETCIDVYF
jgi:hypothetical protein